MSWNTGIAIADLLKRRIWLGNPGESVTCTDEPDDKWQGKKSTERRKRTQRGHMLLYTLRVFVPHEAERYDQAYMTPQTVVQRDDARYPLQGFMQPIDVDSWDRHSRVADMLREIGGPPPPSGAASSSSAMPAAVPIAPAETRPRSRSPRRPTSMALTSKSGAAPPLEPVAITGSPYRDASQIWGSVATAALTGPPVNRRRLSQPCVNDAPLSPTPSL